MWFMVGRRFKCPAYLPELLRGVFSSAVEHRFKYPAYLPEEWSYRAYY